MSRIAAMLTVTRLTAPPARADEPFARGFDAVPLKLTTTANSGLQLDGAEVRPKGSWQLQAILDLNFGVMGLKLGDQRLGELIPFRTDLRIGGSYQLLDRLEVGGELPITVLNLSAFALLREQGFPQDSPRVVGLGAPREGRRGIPDHQGHREGAPPLRRLRLRQAHRAERHANQPREEPAHRVPARR